ncbi:MAG: hypothetical protein A2026_13070 [Deltaproteobacteria bacterium RBG_19FT_COMBO_46_12]|nr:MAG: hypothetical protein A2026_13070 [Deltaproteobacteria bacterium RBG_19FT_COMBO_46_12]
MIYKGIANGKTIKLEESLPYPKGQTVQVSVKSLEPQLHIGSAAAIRQVMHEEPHLKWEDVYEMERAIGQGRLPVDQESVFDGT